jgi:MbtH protein
MSVENDFQIFLVVVNARKQYSIWPQRSAVPAGWDSAGFIGSSPECLDHIKDVWTDMRPEELRIAMADG